MDFPSLLAVDAPRRRKHAAWGAGAVVAGLGLASAAATLVARHGPVVCPFRRLTGLPCPGCGATRATAAFLRGDLWSAVGFNVVWTAALVAFVVLALAPSPARRVWLRRQAARWRSFSERQRLLATGVVFVAAWAWNLTRW
jgi:hypothetical protein